MCSTSVKACTENPPEEIIHFISELLKQTICLSDSFATIFSLSCLSPHCKTQNIYYVISSSLKSCDSHYFPSVQTLLTQPQRKLRCMTQFALDKLILVVICLL